MSDQIPTPSPDDRMRDTLTALRVDADRVGLRDAASVRRRGQARTRHQAVAGLAAAVVVVAVVVSGGSLLGGSNNADRQIVPATPSPSAPALQLAADPFVQPADIGTVGPYGAWQVNPDPVPAAQQPSRCVPFPGTLGGAQNVSRLFYGDLDAGLTEHVIRFVDADAAQGAADRLTQSFASCDAGDPAEVSVDDRQPQDVAGAQGGSRVPDADLAVHASRTSTPVAASEVNYYELGLVREANVLVVLQWSSGPLDGIDWVWDTARMTAALERATG